MRQLLKDFFNSDDKVLFFRSVSAPQQATLLRTLSRYHRVKLMSNLSDDDLLKVFHYMDNDEIVDLLQLMDKKRQKALVDKLSDEITLLMKYNQSIAAGMMNLDYLIVKHDSTFGDVAKHIKKHMRNRSKTPVILVVKDGSLIGELPIHKLILHSKDDKISKHVVKIPSIRYDESSENAIALFKLYPHSRIAVLNKDGSVLGIVHAEDVFRPSEDLIFSKLYSLFGLSSEEDALDSFQAKFKHRVFWLVVNLATAFLAASTVALFENTIARNVILAAYMPIIAGMGGNAATQTLGVMIRGLTLGEVSFSNVSKILFNEVISGVMNGAVTGLIVALVAYIINSNILLGVVAFLALVGNLVIAAASGVIVPIVLEKLGKDPTSSATVFITALTDVLGFLLFLGLATILL